MRNIRKIIGAFLMAVFFTCAFQMQIPAETSGNVYDDAELLSASEMESLNAEIDRLKSITGWEIFAVTASDAGGKSAMEYADDFFDSNTPPDADGAVVLIDMDNREIYISTCGEAIRYLTDARIDRILDGAFGYAGDADYDSCFLAMLNGIENYYNQGIPNGQYNYDTETGERSYYRSLTLAEAAIALIAAAVAAAAVFFTTIGKYRLKFGTYSYDFRKYGELHITNSEDRLINQTTTHRRIPKESSSSHGSSTRSSTHTSSSGRTHGGGGHKF